MVERTFQERIEVGDGGSHPPWSFTSRARLEAVSVDSETSFASSTSRRTRAQIQIGANDSTISPGETGRSCFSLQISVMKRLRERTPGRGEGRSQKTTSHEERHAHWHWCRWANCQRVVRLWKERIWLLATWRHCGSCATPVRRPARIRQPLPPQVTDHMLDRPFELEEYRFAQVLRSSRKRCCGGAFGHDCRPFGTRVGESA